MPIYVYECDTCKDVYEVEQRIVEDALTECRCGKGKVKRVIQPVGIGFKGSGFYVNDVAGSSSAPVKKAEEPAKVEAPKPEAKASE